MFPKLPLRLLIPLLSTLLMVPPVQAADTSAAPLVIDTKNNSWEIVVEGSTVDSVHLAARELQEYVESCGLPPSNIEKMEPNVPVTICKLRRGHWDPAVAETNNKRIEAWKNKSFFMLGNITATYFSIWDGEDCQCFFRGSSKQISCN